MHDDNGVDKKCFGHEDKHYNHTDTGFDTERKNFGRLREIFSGRYSPK
jgi:hypothetical protein